mmetsp:Transcript_47782/g.126738  ORF Transcript_47782/g.126738 Transcript_47782/m.126738 type:complete len:83 (-) Transcript_47782:205-453(-)
MLHFTMLFTAAGYDDPTNARIWNFKGSDWIYDGDNVDGDNRHNVYFNEYDSLDSSPIGWHITEPVEADEVDPWLGAIGGGIY